MFYQIHLFYSKICLKHFILFVFLAKRLFIKHTCFNTIYWHTYVCNTVVLQLVIALAQGQYPGNHFEVIVREGV